MFYFWHILRVINLRNHKKMVYGLDACPGRTDCVKILHEDNIMQSGTQIKQAVAGESGTQAKIKISKRRQNENVKSELLSVNVNLRRERSGFAKNACAGRVQNAFPGVSDGVFVCLCTDVPQRLPKVWLERLLLQLCHDFRRPNGTSVQKIYRFQNCRGQFINHCKNLQNTLYLTLLKFKLLFNNKLNAKINPETSLGLNIL